MKGNRKNAEMLLRIAREDQRAFLHMAQLGSELPRQTFFQAQQAVEKALKAVLTNRSIPIRKTHDLEELYGSLESAGCRCPVALDELVQLTPYAALFRYDDTDIARLDVEVARGIVNRALDWATTEIEGHPQP